MKASTTFKKYDELKKKELSNAQVKNAYAQAKQARIQKQKGKQNVK